MVARAGQGYLGQSLSAADILAVVYGSELRGEHDDPYRDRFVLSPSHYATVLFATLVECGLVPADALSTFGEDGSVYEQIASDRAPGVEVTGGSLGQGLSVAAGMALALRRRGASSRVVAMISDGELDEGQTWEAALLASHHRLANLVVVLDANGSQVDGLTQDVAGIEPILDKWLAFGWHAYEVDGHDVPALLAAFVRARAAGDAPSIIVARTVIAKGIPWLEGHPDGHYLKLTPVEAEQARTAVRGRADAELAITAGQHGSRGYAAWQE